MSVPGLPVAFIAAGGLLVWSGIYNQTLTASLGSILKGNAPTAGPQTTDTAALSGTSATSSTTDITATNSAIANDALQYVGDGYVYGGPSTPNKWDCSSFVSYVLGHDLGMAIPGGSWASVTANGTQHGPASGTYMSFGTSVPLAQAQAGDLLATGDHIGICIGNGQMVSAQDEALGVGVASYTSGFPGGTPVCRRVGT